MNTTFFNVTNDTVSSLISKATSIFHGLDITIILTLVFIILLFFLILLLIRNILSSIIPKFGYFVIVMAVAYILMFVYYLPVYIPQTFTIVQNNTTVVNPDAISILGSKTDIILPIKFYSDLMYFMSMYKVPLYDILVPYFIIMLFYSYFVYSLYPRIGKLAFVIGFVLLFVLSVGMLGFFIATLTYQQLLLMNIIVLLIVTIIAVSI
jgi:hypothetical protein